MAQDTMSRLRADDLAMRSKVSALLGSARKTVEMADREYRREFLPPPSRAKPRHEPGALAGAQMIERLSKFIGNLSSQIAAQPVPEFLKGRHAEEEADILKKLLEWNDILISQAELLRSKLDQKDGSWLIENEVSIREQIEVMSESLRNRQLVLLHL